MTENFNCLECGKPMDCSDGLFCDDCTDKALSDPEFVEFYLNSVIVALEEVAE